MNILLTKNQPNVMSQRNSYLSHFSSSLFLLRFFVSSFLFHSPFCVAHFLKQFSFIHSIPMLIAVTSLHLVSFVRSIVQSFVHFGRSTTTLYTYLLCFFFPTIMVYPLFLPIYPYALCVIFNDQKRLHNDVTNARSLSLSITVCIQSTIRKRYWHWIFGCESSNSFPRALKRVSKFTR